ncbi:Phosphate transport regulator (PhoU-like) [Pyrobaculum sp. WP30]|nr:Phosphate transport regulator (PhoU-like) [Pyrobaculum sp. WP30]
MQRLKKIFSTGLEDIREKIGNHIALSQESLLILQGLLVNKSLDRSAVDEAVRKATALEREGDEIVRDLMDKVAQGAVVPTITNVVMVMLDSVDNVLDMIYFAIKEVKRGHHLWTSEQIYAIVSAEVKEMLDLSKTMLEYLQNMLNARDVDDIRRYARLIGSLEEEIDEIKENILDKIYGLELSAVAFNHLVSLVYTADKIADNIQDAAYHLATVLSSA